MDWIWSFLRRNRRIRQRNSPDDFVGAVHVFRPPRPGVVRLRLGVPTPRDRFPRHFSMPTL